MLQRGDRHLFWEQDRMARSGASGRGGGRKGGLPPLRSRGKQAQGSMGSMAIRLLFLPWFLPYAAGSPGPSPRTSRSPHFRQLPFPPQPRQVDSEVTVSVLLTLWHPAHHWCRPLSLGRSLCLPGPDRGTEGADTAVSAFPEPTPGLPWQVFAELTLPLGSLRLRV